MQRGILDVERVEATTPACHPGGMSMQMERGERRSHLLQLMECRMAAVILEEIVGVAGRLTRQPKRLKRLHAVES